MDKLKQWRIRPLFLAILFIFSITITAFSSTSIVRADTRDVPELLFNEDLYGDLSAHQHYWWLYACFKDFDIDSISKSEMDSWDFFQGEGGQKALGIMYGGDEDDPFGTRTCESQSIVKTAFGYLGATNPREAFCSLAKTYFNGDKKYTDYESCVLGPGPGNWDMDGSEDEQANTFKDKFLSKKPALTPPAEYMRAYSSLMQGCKMSLGNSVFNTVDEAREAGAGGTGDNKYAVPIVVETGDGEFKVQYKVGTGLNGDFRLGLVSSSAGGHGIQYITCDDVVILARDKAASYAAFLGTNGYDQNTGDGTDPSIGSSEPVCSAGALGWVICPLTDLISDATQTIAGIIEDQLIYPSLLTSDQGAAIRTVWGTVLGIANLGLVIVFLFIIFSQATSVGLSSYGVKKILPRLIAAAILMNLSFFLCAIAVDLANILGVSIKGIVQSGIKSIDEATPASDVISADGKSWKAAVVGILGLGVAAFTGTIAFLLPVIISALIAVFTAFLVIAARGIIVTLLIIVAPIAFLAWILPNTEQWFTKWRKLFTTMLLMFPLVMLVFYGSLLVSKLVLVTTAGGGDGDPKVMTNIIALAILTVPLFSLPFIMKAAGGVLDRFGVLVNNRGKGLVDRSRKVAKTAQQHSRFSNAMSYRRENRETDRAVLRAKPTVFNRAMRPVGGKEYGAYTQRRATAIEDKEFQQGVADATTLQQNYGSNQREAIAQGKGEYKDSLGNPIKLPPATGQERVAAAQWVLDKGNFAQRRDLYNSMPDATDESPEANKLRQTVSAGYFSKLDNKVAGAAYGGQLLSGTSDKQDGLERAIAKTIFERKIDANAMVQDADSTALTLKVAQDAIANPMKYRFEERDPSTGASLGVRSINADDINSLKRGAVEAQNNTGTRAKATSGIFKDKIDDIAAL